MYFACTSLKRDHTFRGQAQTLLPTWVVATAPHSTGSFLKVPSLLVCFSHHFCSGSHIAWPGVSPSVPGLTSALDSSARKPTLHPAAASTTHPGRRMVQLHRYKHAADGQTYARDTDTGLLYRYVFGTIRRSAYGVQRHTHTPFLPIV